MDFTIREKNETIVSLARKIGYKPQAVDSGGEYSIIRELSKGKYPRFHIYIKKDNENNDFIFSLHLDQKQPSYSRSHAHSGEYEGDIIESEAERIKNIME